MIEKLPWLLAGVFNLTLFFLLFLGTIIGSVPKSDDNAPRVPFSNRSMGQHFAAFQRGSSRSLATLTGGGSYGALGFLVFIYFLMFGWDFSTGVWGVVDTSASKTYGTLLTTWGVVELILFLMHAVVWYKGSGSGVGVRGFKMIVVLFLFWMAFRLFSNVLFVHTYVSNASDILSFYTVDVNYSRNASQNAITQELHNFYMMLTYATILFFLVAAVLFGNSTNTRESIESPFQNILVAEGFILGLVTSSMSIIMYFYNYLEIGASVAEHVAHGAQIGTLMGIVLLCNGIVFGVWLRSEHTSIRILPLFTDTLKTFESHDPKAAKDGVAKPQEVDPRLSRRSTGSTAYGYSEQTALVQQGYA
jgi:hypothetical protein